jgi:hypothetical protein
MKAGISPIPYEDYHPFNPYKTCSTKDLAFCQLIFAFNRVYVVKSGEPLIVLLWDQHVYPGLHPTYICHIFE